MLPQKEESMGFRFRRRVKIAPGIHLNVSKSGVSTSLGVPGATVNIGKRGVRATVGLPGTGISYQQQLRRSGSSALRSDIERAAELGKNKGSGCLFHSAMILALVFIIAPMASLLPELGAAVLFLAFIAGWVWLSHRIAMRKAQAVQAARSEALAELYDVLCERFGPADGARAFEGRLRQGDSAEFVTAIFGLPVEIDEHVMKTKTKHVYKYDRLSARSFGFKVTLENGQVVGWQR